MANFDLKEIGRSVMERVHTALNSPESRRQPVAGDVDDGAWLSCVERNRAGDRVLLTVNEIDDFDNVNQKRHFRIYIEEIR